MSVANVESIPEWGTVADLDDEEREATILEVYGELAVGTAAYRSRTKSFWCARFYVLGGYDARDSHFGAPRCRVAVERRPVPLFEVASGSLII